MVKRKGHRARAVRRPRGRPYSATSEVLTVRVHPSDGIKAGLTKAASLHGVNEGDVAFEVLFRERENYDVIAELISARRALKAETPMA